MKILHSLSDLEWTLSGWTPHLWRLMQTMELGETPNAEVMGVPARVPGSVQTALRDAGLIPDWTIGENWRACEWVENRHWIYEADLPDGWLQPGKTHRLVCMGLDYRGEIHLNGALVGEFCGAHTPHRFDLTPHLRESGNTLRIVFDLAPRWLGQFGFTSRVRDWKPRFNYTWDWQPRLVQIGVWEEIRLEVVDGPEIESIRYLADLDPQGAGRLRVTGRVAAPPDAVVRVTLARDGTAVRTAELPVERFHADGLAWADLAVEAWWPNLEGGQPLYTLSFALLGPSGESADTVERRVGFRNVVWRPCEGAPPEADPWLCVVNGRPVFLQGVNFPPLLPNFADATQERYRALLTLYRDLGANTLRVNGVGYLEKEWFYDLCDEMGLFVWQDVPLSSSGVDNEPPGDATIVDEAAAVLESFIARRQHHAALLLWCGGNELQRRDETGLSVPCDLSHPLLNRLQQVVLEHDPGRRFLPSTATGPRFNADRADFGKGLHWNVHGPWKPWDDLTDWAAYWEGDDALFRAETGAPGAAPADVTRAYTDGRDPLPVSADNPVWRRPLTWWIEPEQFAAEHGRPPATLEEYVAWSQARQARALSIAVGACKRRFPRCGGILLWCGHDAFPCPANTSIIDYHLAPKPAALALREIWRGA